jgi:hypothetical protein
MNNGWLHIGNIAGNGFEAAQMQRQRGINSDVVNPYLTHVMSHPIWEDVEVSTYIDLNDIDSLKSLNPSWIEPTYYYGGEFASALQSLAKDKGINLESSTNLIELALMKWRHFGRIAYRETRKVALFILRVEDDLLIRVVGEEFENLNMQTISNESESKKSTKKKILRFCYKVCYSLYLIPFKAFSLFYSGSLRREFPGLPSDQYYIIPALRYLNEIATHYQGVVLYGPWTALGAWCKDLNFIALEHGTLRNYIFEDNSWAMACRVGYKSAKKVIVTNADCYPISISEKHSKTVAGIHPFESSLSGYYKDRRKRFLSETHTLPSHIILASRMQFSNSGDAKGSEIALRAISELHQIDLRLSFTVFAYGSDLSRAEKIIQEYGISNVVKISPPLSRPLLLEKFSEALCILDGFSLSGSGRIQIEAWSIGTPVLSKQDLELNLIFFSDPIPTLNAKSKEEIVETVIQISNLSRDQLLDFQRRSIEWYKSNHSPERFLSYLNFDE